MPKKKREGGKATSVRVGDITSISGNVNVAGGNITTHRASTTLGAAEIKQLFDQLHAAIEARPETAPATKDDLMAEFNEIQSGVTEVVQGRKNIDEGFLSRRFRNIARIAPDMLDVVVATLANPLAGLGVAVKKIAERAKEETT